jgi:hypothetical protein
LVVGLSGHLPKFFREFLLQGDPDRIRVKAYAVQLFGDPLHIVGMRVADADHGMASIHIQVLPVLVIPHVRPPGPNDRDVIDGIYVEEFHAFAVLRG